MRCGRGCEHAQLFGGVARVVVEQASCPEAIVVERPVEEAGGVLAHVHCQPSLPRVSRQKISTLE